MLAAGTQDYLPFEHRLVARASLVWILAFELSAFISRMTHA